MKKIVASLVLLFAATTAFAGDRADDLERLRNGALVIREIMDAPDKGVPEEVISNTKCIAVIPNMLKAAFVFGGAYGKGVASCRIERGWSAPAFFSLKGGSWGLQIGGESADIVMLIMNEEGMNNLLEAKFKLGADASVAAGPVGRHADASTDWKMRAQVLTYSRARGVFAGISLNGAVINENREATRDFYGRMVPFKTILRGNIASPLEAEKWHDTLVKYAGK